MSDDQVAMDTRGTVTVATYVDDHAEWRRLAEAATPGPWVTSRNSWGSPMDVHAKHRDYMLPVALVGGDKTCGYYGHNAAYIAHSSPDRVLALLEENARMRSALTGVLADAGLEDDYNTKDSDGRFISKSVLLAVEAALAEHHP